MYETHPKLIRSLVSQTKKAMIGILIISIAYILIFNKFIPATILILWFLVQVFLVIHRFYNIRMMEKYLKLNNKIKINEHKKYFIITNILQSCMWTMSSILVIMYAPQPYELVSFLMIIGIIATSSLSMGSFFNAYLVFFFSMIIPQIIILLYYGEQQHVGLVILTLIYIPTIILLSRAIYNTCLTSIKVTDELEKSVEELHKLSIMDSLTNIYNRRYFFEVSQSLISIATREQKSLSLLMLDIDNFKEINDSYGHQIGDYILVDLVKEIEQSMRESDLFARIGGEEFAILLNDTSPEGAIIIAEKIRKVIKNKAFDYDSISINTSISIGISELNKENKTIEELYKKSDDNLYIAKKKGKNRVFPK